MNIFHKKEFKCEKIFLHLTVSGVSWIFEAKFDLHIIEIKFHDISSVFVSSIIFNIETERDSQIIKYRWNDPPFQRYFVSLSNVDF